MKNIFFLAATFITLNSLCFAQTTGLKIGAQMPTYKFPKVINWHKTSIDLKEFRGKYVILDLWATSCSSCIAAFPKMQKLNDQFKDKLQVILVNIWDRDTKDAAFKILKRFRLKFGIPISLPISLNDEVLNSYFPAHSIPHEVIIDPRGKIYAITSGEDITSERLERLISGKKVDFPLKDDFWNRNLPLVVNTNPTSTNGLLVNSTLTRSFVPGFYDALKTNEKGEVIGQILTNLPLISLYSRAYPELFNTSLKVIYETKDSIFQNVEEDRNKWFSYDLIVPAGKFVNTNQIFAEHLRKDLDKAFNFSFKKEKRLFPCLIIRSNTKISAIHTKQDSTTIDKYKPLAFWKDESNLKYWKESKNKHIPVYIRQVTLSSLISQIKWYTKVFVDVGKIVDESEENKNSKFDLEFPVDFDFDDEEKLIAFLHKNGIDLLVENREMDCVIVSDKKTGEPTVMNN